MVTVAAEAAWTEVPPKARRRAADRVNANFFINHLKRTERRRVSDFCWDAAYGKQGGCIKHLIERRQRNAGVQPGETGAVGELCRADGVKGGSFREREIGRALGFRQGCGVPLMSGMGEGLRDE